MGETGKGVSLLWETWWKNRLPSPPVNNPMDRSTDTPSEESRPSFAPRLGWRKIKGYLFLSALASTVLTAIVLLCVLLMEVSIKGFFWLDWQFLTSFPSRFPERAGILAPIAGSIWVILLTALFSVPLGVGAAIYLEEYAKKSRLGRIIEINISNLAGVPSIIYGLLGLVVFVRFFLLGRSVITAALTMTLVILPVIIVAAREALKGVPGSIREASYALGATRWQTIRAHVLPAALPGILTGVILALSRAIGETAPLIMTGAVAYVAFVPDGIFSAYTVLPIQIYDWAARPQEAFHEIAAAAIIVLLVLLLTLNAIAIFIRNHYQRKFRW